MPTGILIFLDQVVVTQVCEDSWGCELDVQFLK